ncbi:unnamed protein product [Phaedon cochleariae]|uniref:GIY-YIG domain-containing protein n=1 Tax=Phaedon cochleariae TaxID=80249 RepID=A0A9N9SEF3_PHACE|nr:unnamed protein product [Phaedon cochleariae]
MRKLKNGSKILTSPKLTLRYSTTFQADKKNSRRIPIPYNPKYTKGLDKVFKDLGNPKDKVDTLEKSGIYEISCNDCDKTYIGQTRRPIKTRFKEHIAHLKYGRLDKSCVAEHMFNHNHNTHITNLKLVKQVNNIRKLDAYESLEIFKNSNRVMNKDNGPIPYSPLYSLFKSVSGSIEEMLARLEEFQTMLYFVTQDRIDYNDILTSIPNYGVEFDQICNKIDTLESLISHIQSNLDQLEHEIEKAETELGCTETSAIKVTNIFTPLFELRVRTLVPELLCYKCLDARRTRIILFGVITSAAQELQYRLSQNFQAISRYLGYLTFEKNLKKLGGKAL